MDFTFDYIHCCHQWLKIANWWRLVRQLGLAVTQSSFLPGNQVNTISQISEFKKHIALKITNIVSRVGRSKKNHAVQSKIYKNFQPSNRQLNLDPVTANYCNININSGDMTGTYRFQTGFYGLTDMPAEFQKAVKYTLIGLKTPYCFLDDILIVSKGSEKEHKQHALNCFKRLDEENVRINHPKCLFSKFENDWRGCHISQSVISSLESKTSAILALEEPKSFKKLRSFLGSVRYISKFIPNLAQVSHTLRPVLKKSIKFIWPDAHEKHFLK